MYEDLVLAHYSAEVTLEPRSVVQKDKQPHRKPQGLWVSVEGGEYGWKEWGMENSYGCFDHRFSVTLAEGHNVLITEDLYRVHNIYKMPLRFDGSYELIDWMTMSRYYQGIIIPRYCWEHRFDTQPSNWYYGWDCASGCIWDAAAIASVVYDTEYEAPADAPDMSEQEIPF